MRTVEELVARAPDRFDITVIGGEPHPNYNCILLSSVLAGERTLAEIVIQPSSWYEKHGIHLIAGNHATAIDPVTRPRTLIQHRIERRHTPQLDRDVVNQHANL